MASPGNRHCVNCIGALSFPIDLFLTDWLQTQRTGSHSSEHVYSDGTAYIGIRELQLIARCERSRWFTRVQNSRVQASSVRVMWTRLKKRRKQRNHHMIIGRKRWSPRMSGVYHFCRRYTLDKSHSASAHVQLRAYACCWSRCGIQKPAADCRLTYGAKMRV